jgi:hypothetical protein
MAALWFAVSHATQRDGRNVEAGFAKFDVLHGFLLFLPCGPLIGCTCQM